MMAASRSLPIAGHPNDVDRKRIERALQSRQRYLYVRPTVVPAAGGYRIESPCCSRNVDREGGVVDVALIQFSQGTWRLYRKDHVQGVWELHGAFGRLGELLDLLNVDADRQFWQ
ncbi:hypothetical protein [Nitrospirillum sp. BR 11828]|uniref:DUF3024 domain-containing protein n=1 Tax=Nitrospirillum sp. BR 11828 TaxID=3104325 RepID=UPI002ACA2E7F|nr:hypothetical protein [Nitrospirillum sp. BR 11828]MDZ5649922.1 hypothetical protein [Nitrospirillum sp. BR 11828]